MNVIKFLTASFLIINYIVVGLIINFLFRSKKVSSLLTSCYSKIVLKVLNIKVKHNDFYKNKSLIISNHLSYLDILVISSVYPSIFITSKEVENDKFLGLLCKINNSIFVERRNFSTINEDNDKIISDLKNVSVVLFPEGTSSNGNQVLPFKSSLLKCVETEEIIIQPLCIFYHIKDEDKDSVYYYGGMKFPSHFWNLFSIKSINAEILFLDKIKSKSRKEASKLTYDLINRSRNEIRSDILPL